MDDSIHEAAARRSVPAGRFDHTPAAAPMKTPWRKYFYRFINAVYFQRITLVHAERLPETGPVLYLGLHRNGAVDGLAYTQALRDPVFMISTQLRKSWLARLFFDGIAVTRTKDEGDRARNDAALRRCLDHLRGGGNLFVFPEGTSSLGPRHLPFKSGAVWLLLDYLESGAPLLQVVPVGIHYQCPWAFRSRVEVVVGRQISTELPAHAARLERLRLLKHRVQAALEDVGINVPSAEYLARIQCLAAMAVRKVPRSYFKSLKAMEHEIPETIVSRWRELEPVLQRAKPWRHHGVPLFPARALVLDGLMLCFTAPLVLAAIAANLPAIAAGWFAAKHFPDDRNVISLWKILIGLPVLSVWIGIVVVTLILLKNFLWLGAYAAVTWFGVTCYDRFKQTAVTVYNALRHPELRLPVQAFHRTVLQSLPDETV